ncbi:MAG: hypothetical protein PF481_05555 [Bacteroidales bacterium]|jgi:hypothetical protein|nr:hypothetical protein [Bacteroidales bacterium]
MNNSLLHVGLQISEKDLVPFYELVLQGYSNRSFVLPKDQCEEIFSISQDTKIIYMMYEGFELELFVYEHVQGKSFNHVCISSENAEKMYKTAQQIGYFTYKRVSKNGSYTYFLSDSSHNMFEIKKV